jgi:gliding motility-associated-like protein
LTINPDGTVSVAPNTPAGTYTIAYTICYEEMDIPTKVTTYCDTATVTVVVEAAVIDAVDDDFSDNTVDGDTGGTVADANVFDNDTLNGSPLNQEDITLTSEPNGPLSINPDGSVEVASNTPEGTYTIDYTICENLNPGNCDTATVTVEVISGLILVNQLVTPNGDGKNDFLFIKGVLTVPNNSLKIFNRWGVAVYEGSGYNNQNNIFDGRSKGRSTLSVDDYLPAGVYFYIFEYQKNQDNITDSGYLYLSK